MRRIAFAGLTFVIVASLAAWGFTVQDGKWDARQLRSTLVQLGHEVKDLNTEAGKEKYEIKVNKGGYDIFVAFEVSPSTNYIWLTVLLGDKPEERSIRNAAFLKENSKVQPSHFYVSSNDKLMLGLPVDNRGMTNPLMRQRIEAITENVVSTVSLWVDGE